MNNNETLEYEDIDGLTYDSVLESKLEMSILTICEIPSIICALVLYYYFIRLQEIRKDKYTIMCKSNFFVVVSTDFSHPSLSDAKIQRIKLS